MSYLALKQAHIVLAIVSISGFVLRWSTRRTGHWLTATVPARTVPHLIDSLLLAAGIALSMTIAQYPLTHAWLTAKIAGLVAYILLGVIAMRSAPGSRRSVLAFLAAVAVFAWIASIARSKSAWGFLGAFGA